MGQLRFRLFGFPIAVQPSFWLLSILLGYLGNPTFSSVVVWVSVVFASVLTHELGHAFAARRFGQEPVIQLYMLGGVTFWRPTQRMSRPRQILTSLAGPFAGFGLAMVAGAVGYHVLPGVEQIQALLVSGRVTPVQRGVLLLVVVNVFYGAINLIPVLPFDGGRVLDAALGPKRRNWTLALSVAFGLGIGAFWLWRGEELLGGIIAGASMLTAWNLRRAEKAVVPPEMLVEVALRARRALDAGDARQAIEMGRAVFHTNGPTPLRVRGFEIAAWGAIQLGDAAEARALLDELPDGAAPDPIVVAAIHEIGGAVQRSVEVLQRARDTGDRRPELAGHLIRVLLAARRYEAACALTRETLDCVDSDEARRVAREALGAGAPRGAGELYADVFARDGVVGDAVEAARAFLRATDPERARGVLQAALRSGAERAAIIGHDAELAALI